MLAATCRWRVAVVAGATGATLLLALTLGRVAAPAPPQFRNVRALKAWAQARGLCWQSDREDGRVLRILVISTRPLTWMEVAHMCRIRLPGRERGPERGWDGIVWAIDRDPTGFPLAHPPWEGECRIWGDILVKGDPRLLDWIEAAGE
jgi:hypothetical protein